MKWLLWLGLAVRGIFNHTFEKSNSAGLIGLISITLMCSPAAHSQTSTDINITPVISFLLFNDCPVVTAATTEASNQNISTQTDLDALKGITRIEGDLNFNTAPSTLDFAPLDSLVEITGTVRFFNSDLTNVSGLDCLADIGGDLNIVSNAALTEITGFSSLASISGKLNIATNPVLTTIPQFLSLASISGDMTINSNAVLTSLAGFSTLTAISGDLTINGNDVLTSLAGFSALNTIGGNLIFRKNIAITSYSGFSALSSIGGRLDFAFNDTLAGFPGFPALTSIGDNFFIANNATLISLPGFSALASIGGDIRVFNNTQFDCRNPVPSFVPATHSFGNTVNCDLITHTAASDIPAPIAIPDNDTNGISDSIIIPTREIGTINQLTVDLDISHTAVNDLTLTLSDGTTSIELVKNPNQSGGAACTSNNIAVNLSDLPVTLPDINSSCEADTNAEAFPGSSYKPLQALSGFMDSEVNGTWTLMVTDTTSGETGTLNSWGLNFTKNRL